MRLAFLFVCLPLAAHAGANPQAVYSNLIIGTWAESPAACSSDLTWEFSEGSVIIQGDGGESCGFDGVGTDGGIDVVLDVLCPIPGETAQASARRIGLELDSVSPGLPDPGDLLTVLDRGQSIKLRRCPPQG